MSLVSLGLQGIKGTAHARMARMSAVVQRTEELDLVQLQLMWMLLLELCSRTS